jgi:hypothetical protein
VLVIANELCRRYFERSPRPNAIHLRFAGLLDKPCEEQFGLFEAIIAVSVLWQTRARRCACRYNHIDWITRWRMKARESRQGRSVKGRPSSGRSPSKVGKR